MNPHRPRSRRKSRSQQRGEVLTASVWKGAGEQKTVRGLSLRRSVVLETGDFFDISNFRTHIEEGELRSNLPDLGVSLLRAREARSLYDAQGSLQLQRGLQELRREMASSLCANMGCIALRGEEDPQKRGLRYVSLVLEDTKDKQLEHDSEMITGYFGVEDRDAISLHIPILATPSYGEATYMLEKATEKLASSGTIHLGPPEIVEVY